MLSIYYFQMNGFKIFVSILAMKILAKATAILYPWLHHGFVDSVFHRTGMNFLLSFELTI